MPEEGKLEPRHPYKGWLFSGVFFLATDLTLTLLSESQIMVQGMGEDTPKLETRITGGRLGRGVSQADDALPESHSMEVKCTREDCQHLLHCP